MGVKIADDFTGGADPPRNGRRGQGRPKDHAQALTPNVIAAVGEVFAGVTVASAARSHGCTISEINEALALPEAQRIEPTSEWDAVDLLTAEFRDTPDVLAGLVPVGVTLVSAAPKVGKTRWLTQLSVAAVRGERFLD